ncbi:MAG: tRNA pseudouridine(55) synthase TruB [Deltaproteobacteria bacterium]
MIDGVVVLDKPPGITSFRAVDRIRRILRVKKCGHAGTLDPLATGVLPICVGRATKIAGYLAGYEKEYDAVFRFGTETDTGDRTGTEIASAPGAFAEESAVREAVNALVGTWEQVPPDFSAVKVAGTRAYRLARKGTPVELSPRPVTVHEARVAEWSREGFRIVLRCSKGFYVRALSRDLGRLLQVPMTVQDLCRRACGPFRLEESISLDRLADAEKRGEARTWLLPISKALAGVPQVAFPPEGIAAIRQGRPPVPWMSGASLPPSCTLVLVTNAGGVPVALVGRVPPAGWKIVRGI